MNVHQVELMGRSFKIRSQDESNHVQAVADYVNGRIAAMHGTDGGAGPTAPAQNVLLLASLNMADELFKLRAEHAELRERIRSQSRALLERLAP